MASWKNGLRHIRYNTQSARVCLHACDLLGSEAGVVLYAVTKALKERIDPTFRVKLVGNLTYRTTSRHGPVDHSRHLYRWENLTFFLSLQLGRNSSFRVSIFLFAILLLTTEAKFRVCVHKRPLPSLS